MERYLRTLIAEGENQRLDFKFCVSDSRKIARTLVAFANSEGGKILIGVRDNGSIAGIRTDEEVYMIDTAAHLYCKPEIKFSIRQYSLAAKTVVEVIVEKGEERPYRVKDEDGRWIAYFRHKDQNLVANRVLLQVWRKEQKPKGVMVKFGKAENILLDYLSKNNSITISKFRKISSIPTGKAEAILANLLILRVIVMVSSEHGTTYELNSNPDRETGSAN